MRVAVPVLENNGLDSPISPHFGRCPFFVIAEVDGEEVKSTEVITNPYYPNHEPGQIPAFIHSQNVNVMLAGGMGGRAIQFFQQYGIEAATGASGSVAESLTTYLSGKLSDAAPCSDSVEHGCA